MINGKSRMNGSNGKGASETTLLQHAELVDLITSIVGAWHNAPQTPLDRLPPIESWRRLRGGAANRKWCRLPDVHRTSDR